MKKNIFVLILSILLFSFCIPVAYCFENRYTVDFESSIVSGISSGSRVEKFTEAGEYCYKIGSLKNDVDSVVQFDSKKSGLISISMDIYFENNTNAFCFTLRDDNGKEAVKLRFVNQEIMTAYTSEDGGITTSVFDLSSVTSPCTWERYTFEVNTNTKQYRILRGNSPLISEWIPFYRAAENIKNILVETSKGSFTYLDNIDIYNFNLLDTTVSSLKYTVDNTNKMITDIPYKTDVIVFLENITSQNSFYLCDKLGNKKESGTVLYTDTLYVYDNNSYTYYSLGITDNNFDIKEEFSTLNITKKLYVSPDGKDTNRGTSVNSPYKTLQKCAENLKNTASAIKGDAVIYLKGGIYEYMSFNRFISDCSLPSGKIVICPYNGEKVTVTGAKSIKPSEFTKIEDTKILKRLDENVRDKVLMYDVSALDSSLFGARVMSGWNLGFVPSRMELYKNNELQTLARYPDMTTVTTKEILIPEESFIYSDTEIESWEEPEKAWIWSHFGVEYGGHDIKIKEVNTQTKAITVDGEYYSSPKGNFKYYYDNVLEELNKPGEWYFDEDNNKIYYYPDDDFNGSTFYLSLLQDNLISFHNVNNIYIKDITFAASRGDILGFYDCNNVLIENCNIFGAGMNGIVISGGENNCVVNSEVSYTGGDAIKIYGGNNYTLSPSKSGVYDCILHDFSKRKKSYTGGVALSGVGITVKNNQIYDAPHLGVYLRGNDFEITNNVFSNLVYNAKDMGAVYTYNNYVWRGSVISDNVFYNIRNINPDNSPNLSKCVFLDNFSSGYEVKRNIFKNCDEGVHANGGRNNIISKNVFYDVDKSVALNNFTTICDPPYSNLKTAPVNSVLWKSKYDGIEKTSSLYPGTPYKTFFGNNLIVNNTKLSVEDREKITVSDNFYISEYDSNSYREFINKSNINENNAGTVSKNSDADKILIIKDSKVFSGTYELLVGQSVKFDYLLTGKTGKNNIKPQIRSLNEDILTVDEDFNVTAIKPGTATVLITYKDITSKIKIRNIINNQ